MYFLASVIALKSSMRFDNLPLPTTDPALRYVRWVFVFFGFSKTFLLFLNTGLGFESIKVAGKFVFVVQFLFFQALLQKIPLWKHKKKLIRSYRGYDL